MKDSKHLEMVALTTIKIAKSDLEEAIIDVLMNLEKKLLRIIGGP